MLLLQLFSVRSLLEGMTRADAKKILVTAGANETDLESSIALGRLRRRLMKKVYTDKGGSNEVAAKVNAAIDLLKQSESDFEPQTTGWAEREEITPKWAMAGYSGGVPPNAHISQQTYRDVNFIKKTMYELSSIGSQKQEVFTVTAFDGYFFRNSFTCYASMGLLTELAAAMIIWNSKGGNPYPTRAVFIQKNNKPDLWLIYSDGEFLIRRSKWNMIVSI